MDSKGKFTKKCGTDFLHQNWGIKCEQNGICTQRQLRSAWAHTQSDQSSLST